MVKLLTILFFPLSIVRDNKNVCIRGSKLEKLKILILIVITFGWVGTIVGQTKIQLVTAGRSKYSIVIPANANAVEVKAASVLQSYISKISNAHLPIVSQQAVSSNYQLVLTTNSNSSPTSQHLSDDGFLIIQVQNSLHFTGGPRKGLLYAVYAFLEDFLDCQAFTKDFIKVPSKQTIVLPAAVYKREEPSFSFRMTYFPDVLDSDFCDWRKVNFLYEDWGQWVHSFDFLLPPKQYFGTHPEYFALRNGVRKPTQPCLSNPDVLKIISANLKTKMQNYPIGKYWSISQNDNEENCQCDNCRKLDEQQQSPQGSLLTFVNAVARQFPKEIITTLAYQYSEKPPKSIRPEKNVMIMLCNAYNKNQLIPLFYNPAFTSTIKSWSSITSELFVWDYVTQFEHYFIPFPTLFTYQPNIRYFAAYKTKYLYILGPEDRVGEFSELKCYLVSKLMWNKDANVKNIIYSFANNYYGKKSAPYIIKYLTLLYNNAKKSNAKISMQGLLNEYFTSFLSLSNIISYKSLFNVALARADSNSVYFNRILKEYSSILYAELENYKSSIASASAVSEEQRQSYLDHLNQWYKIMKKLKIVNLNEGAKTIDNYYLDFTIRMKSK